MKQRELLIPPKPEKPNIGRPPKIVQKMIDDAKEHGYGSETDSWRRERCFYCHVIIGKDYGSYSHTCDVGDAYKKWKQEEWEYERALEEYERAVFLSNIKDRLIAVGMDEEDAITIVSPAIPKYDPESYLWDTIWFLEKLEEQND